MVNHLRTLLDIRRYGTGALKGACRVRVRDLLLLFWLAHALDLPFFVRFDRALDFLLLLWLVLALDLQVAWLFWTSSIVLTFLALRDELRCQDENLEMRVEKK